jgi:hypothetical protein
MVSYSASTPKPQELHQRRIELLRFLEIADAEDEMIHSNDTHHVSLLVIPASLLVMPAKAGIQQLPPA